MSRGTVIDRAQFFRHQKTAIFPYGCQGNSAEASKWREMITLKHAERQLRYYEKLVAKLRQTSDASDTKEKGKGKEKFPPHHLMKREREEKAPPPPPARACVGAVNGNPTFEAVERYAVLNGIAIDFARRLFDKLNRENEFHRWRHPKSGQPLRNWQAYFSICWKRRDDFDPLPAAEKTPPKPRVYTPADWQLCAERCAHFDATRNCCARGIAVPPDKRNQPEPPELCHSFRKVENRSLPSHRYVRRW